MLPPLRDELVLHAGPTAGDGSPTWTLHDPARNRYFRLSWQAFEILSRWDAGDLDTVAQRVNAETTLNLDAEDVEAMARFIVGNFLTRPGVDGTARLLQAAKATQHSWGQWLLHHYLFFRIPLVRPDHWLGQSLPHLAWIFRPAAGWVTLAALILGLILVQRQWDHFVTTLVSTATLSGLAWYGLALAGAKVCHELGHAFTAKRLGCRVPTMGVAFLVMWPVLYTDVTDAWKLTSRRQRLAIGSAGIATELIIAAWATLAWAILPDGPARSAAFVLATTTWIGTLVVNLSPFMRFDGYFLAMDAFDLPNLHGRAFAQARWWLREVLFSLGEPAPEPFPPLRRAWLIAFAIGTWIYRLALFLGIAVLVYHFFIKAVGVLLFVVEIGWFVLLPLKNEIKEWWERRQAIAAARRGRLWLAALLALLLLAVIPWQSRLSAPAMLKAGGHSPLFTPAPGQVLRLDVIEGQQVEAGQVIAVLTSPDLEYRLKRARARAAVLDYEMAGIGFEPSFLAQAQQLTEGLAGAMAEIQGLEQEIERLTITAPVSGRVVDLDSTVRPRQWLATKTRLMGLVEAKPPLAEAIVDEHDRERLSIGDTCTFYPEQPAWPVMPCRVSSIDKVGSALLPLPQLADLNGGPIAVRSSANQLVSQKSLTRIRLDMVPGEDPPPIPTMEIRGNVTISAGRTSLLGGALRSVLAVMIREFGV
ncbi:biotin/lipoyl-binding protein [Magnetospirillum sulfuroxidans]|uniref:Biotin/lipoyl-binding protein n=1 Tax=Magnetospirillum sulfuroxidans TaxID=611300 RepID=A0ABS5IA67_9PROT|nr:biotin/lipoyl-binding protein [Magnetospirillum sulfuroxidans]MBR9971309.1 biotin/lipoyl-binding protein [Magnetospirillum sulfuroxidans]